MMTTIYEQLQYVGLTSNQATIYLALFKLGDAKAGELIKKTGFHRNLVYGALEELAEKKLISVSKKKGVFIYKVLSPNRLLAEAQEKERVASEERAAAQEEKRRDRALLSRYPSKAVHDKERAQALEQVNEVIKASAKRTQELAEQRASISMEMEFYKKDPSKAPAALKRRIDENDASVAVQRRFLTEQDLEKRRVNLRFDEELVKLKQLWAMASAPVAAAGNSPPAPATQNATKKPNSP